jgi:hypothetical protein
LDGRLLWRVFDNLLGNICKYAQPGTRVYVDAARVGGTAEITLKTYPGIRSTSPPTSCWSALSGATPPAQPTAAGWACRSPGA